jgi:hypothetical protein
MDVNKRLAALLELADRLGVLVRAEPLGGEGGGLCTLRGRRVLFVDVQADPDTQYDKTLAALAGLGDLDNQYILPEIRDALEERRNKEGRAG